MTDGTIDIHMTIVLRNNRVIRAPSVLHFMDLNNWSRDDVIRYCRERGWRFTIRDEDVDAAKAST
jgi:hypothetical protein